MPIKIDNIKVKNLGPIPEFNMDFGQLNVIYSQNEKGKTFLTEFIINSLFGGINRWKYRDTNTTGKITVSGIPEHISLEFSPKSKLKLESHLKIEHSGFSELGKLIIVKGAEVSITVENDGISSQLLTSVLSGEEVLNSILKNISLTIRSATLNSGAIQINRTGEGKTYQSACIEVEKVDKLIEKIQTNYSSGPLCVFAVLLIRVMTSVGPGIQALANGFQVSRAVLLFCKTAVAVDGIELKDTAVLACLASSQLKPARALATLKYICGEKSLSTG